MARVTGLLVRVLLFSAHSAQGNELFGQLLSRSFTSNPPLADTRIKSDAFSTTPQV